MPTRKPAFFGRKLFPMTKSRVIANCQSIETQFPCSIQEFLLVQNLLLYGVLDEPALAAGA